MADAAKISSLDTMKEMYQIFFAAAAVLAFVGYCKFIQNREYWIKTEAAFGFMMTLLIPFAGHAMSFYLEDGGDEISIHLFRLLMIFMAAQSVALYLNKDSSDPSVSITIFITNILTRGGLILCDSYGLMNIAAMSRIPLYCDILVLSMLLVGDIFHLSKLRTTNGHLTVGDPICWHLSVDGMLMFLLGAVLLGFPKLALGIMFPGGQIKEVNVLLSKAVGCATIGGSLLSFASLTFQHLEDTLSVLKAKCLAYLFILLFGVGCNVCNLCTASNFQSSAHIWDLLFIGGLAFNAGYGVWHEMN